MRESISLPRLECFHSKAGPGVGDVGFFCVSLLVREDEAEMPYFMLDQFADPVPVPVEHGGMHWLDV